jgi:hypothetical protein
MKASLRDSPKVELGLQALPKWYPWLDLLYGMWLLIIPVGWLGLIGFPVWILITTLLVFRAEAAASAAPAFAW